MRLFAIIGLVLGLLVIQTTLLPRLLPVNVRPDLILLVAIYLALAHTPEQATLSGFLCGLLQDAFSGGPLGMNAFAKSFLSYAASGVEALFFVGNLAVQLAVVALVTLLQSMVHLLLRRLFVAPPLSEAPVGYGMIWAALPWELLLNCLFWLPLRPVMKQLFPMKRS